MSKALAKLPTAWQWSGVKSDTDDRSLQLGELTSLVNWRRSVEGRLQKRLGNDRTTTSSFTGATYAGPVTDVVPSDALIVRDTSNQLFARDSGDGVGYYRGTDPRAHPTWKRVENSHAHGGVHKPLAVKSTTTTFVFSLGYSSAGAKQIQVTEHDAATGVVVTRPVFIAAADIVAYTAAADASGNVWLAWVTSAAATVIQTRKLATGGTVATTNSITIASTEFKDLKLRLMPNGEMLLVAISVDTVGANYTVKRYHAYLNTSSGAAKTSPAGVTATVSTGPANPGPSAGPGLSIGDASEFTTTYYYHLWYAHDSTTLRVGRVNVTPADLVAADFTSRTVTVGTDADLHMGATAAYVTSGGAIQLFSSVTRIDPSNNFVASRTSTVVKTVSAVDTTVARSAYLAGADVWKVGSARFILTGHDDMFQDTQPGTQRGYFVRDTDGRIATTVLDGVAGQIFFNGGVNTSGRYDWALSMGHMVSSVVAGTKAYLPLLEAGSALAIHEPVLATLDFAATYDSRTDNIIPGGVPKSVGPADPVTELSPIHYPYVDLAIVSDGSEPGVNSQNFAAYRYVTMNAAGDRVPSAPRPTQDLTFHDYASPSYSYTVRIPTLRHTCGPVWIELFVSDDQSENLAPSAGTELYLCRRVPNDPTADSVDVQFQPAQFKAGSGELLDTVNLTARLPNLSVPPARLWAVWRDRLWGAGTPEDDLIYSQELRPGHGYELNAGGLSVDWRDGTGPVAAHIALSFDALVVFRQDAIGLITGAGPDPAGNGNYQVQTISAQKGTTNPKGVVAGPGGVYFIATDGRPNLLTPGGQIVEIGKGYEAYTAQVPVAAVHDVAQRVMRWYMASGKQLKLDYAHPLADQPAGQWYEDNNSNLPAAVGAVVLANVATMVEAGSASVVRHWQAGTGFTDNATAVLKDLVTGRMAPAGLLGEFDVDLVQLSSTKLGGDSAYTYTLTDGAGNAEAHADPVSATADVEFRSALSRTREVRLRIQETSATGEGRSFDGVAMVVRPRGRIQNPYRRIS